MDRRTLLKRTGAITAGTALAGGATPLTGASVAAVAAQTDEFDVWTTYTDEIRAGIVEEIGTEFADANGLRFSHRGWTLDELANTLPRTVDSDQGPDISQVNNGEALAGPMIRGGQILSLAESEAEYGWGDRFAESLLARCRFSEDGTVFGEGDLWGLPAESEIVGFYYNKKIFSDAGVSVPTTFADFEALLADLREAGREPLVFGTLDKWQAIHLFGEIQGTNTTRDYLDGLIYRRGDADFSDPSILEAANKVMEWNDAGYFMEGYNGVSGDDAQALFQSGVGAILLQGSWAAGAVRDSLGEDAGFFLMPKADPNVPVLHVGGVGIPFSITTNAADPAMAASFIDSLVSEDSFEKFIAAGTLPLGEIPDDQITEDTVDGDMYAAWNTALADDAVGHYMDWAAPDFYDVLTGALQELLGGQVTPEEFQTTLQDFYAASFA